MVTGRIGVFWVWAAPVLKYQSSQIMGNNEGGQQSTHWQASYLVSVAVTSVRGHVLVSKAQEGPFVVPVSHAVGLLISSLSVCPACSYCRTDVVTSSILTCYNNAVIPTKKSRNFIIKVYIVSAT